MKQERDLSKLNSIVLLDPVIKLTNMKIYESIIIISFNLHRDVKQMCNNLRS